MPIRFAEGKIEDHFDAAAALTEDNVKETGFKQLEADFKPSLKQYVGLQNIGMLRCFLAFHDEKLIGYCVMIIAKHHHYGGKLWATQDVLYLDPDYRGITSIKFIKYIDERLREEKDIVISRTVSVRKDYSRVLIKLGYGELERVYVKGE
jgi:hypothetical protein